MALLANGSDGRFDLQNCQKRGASSAPQLLIWVFTTKIVIVGEQFFGRGCGKQSFQSSVFSFEDLDVLRLSRDSDSFDSLDSWFTIFAFR